MTFSKRLGIECASSFSMSRVTFCHAKRSRLFSSFIVLGAGYLYVVSSIILQMFSMGLRSGEFADQPFSAIKFGKFFWHHVWVTFEVWAGAPSWTNVISFFELNNFLSIWSPVKTSIFLCWRFLAIFLVEMFRFYFAAFSIDFRAALVKTDGRPLLGLSSKHSLFDHLLTQCTVLLKNLPISLTEWPDDRSMDARAL